MSPLIPRKRSLGCQLDLAETFEKIEADYPILHQWIETVEQKGYKFYAVDQRRGRAYSRLAITIPCWCFSELTKQKKHPEYAIYYIAHEVAHVIAGFHNQHNLVFMNCLKEICPLHLVAFELDYKPKNAKAAGIGYDDVEI